jgi:hypothetical protein
MSKFIRSNRQRSIEKLEFCSHVVVEKGKKVNIKWKPYQRAYQFGDCFAERNKGDYQEIRFCLQILREKISIVWCPEETVIAIHNMKEQGRKKKGSG